LFSISGWVSWTNVGKDMTPSHKGFYPLSGSRTLFGSRAMAHAACSAPDAHDALPGPVSATVR
jgi:hypothetical protein